MRDKTILYKKNDNYISMFALPNWSIFFSGTMCVASTPFVPYTPDGALATALRAYEKKRGAKKRIRIVERAGVGPVGPYMDAVLNIKRWYLCTKYAYYRNKDF